MNVRNLRHGHAAARTPTYRSWMAMNARCLYSRKATDVRYYQKAGVKICARWRRFENFLFDMGERPAGTTLDRIDGRRGYAPDNCRWATGRQQAVNRRNSRTMIFRGKRRPLVEVAEATGVSIFRIWQRLRSGWTDAAAARPVLRRGGAR
jgi:hypothetical protein